MKLIKIAISAGLCALFLTSCANDSLRLNRYSQKNAISGVGGTYKIGNPYKIMGQWYYPKEDYNYVETGVASWYGKDFHAKYTANGEVYDMNTLTAAHRTLPLPSVVKVTNLSNGRSLVLRVNDRGPFAKNRIIDVSKRAAQILGFQDKGTTKVRVELMRNESKMLKAKILGESYVPELDNTPKYKSKPIPKMELHTAENNHYQPANSAYYVQAGAFNSVDGANSLKDTLSDFQNVKIVPAEVNGGRFFRVRMGPFDSKEEADNVLSEVKEFGIYNAKTVND